MRAPSEPRAARAPAPAAGRQAATATLRGGAFERWTAGPMLVAGGGLLGGPFALAAARSGARVTVCDPDVGEAVNEPTQPVRAGIQKVESLAEAAAGSAPGRLTGLAVDVRHVGVGVLREFRLMVDGTDDDNLAEPLTAISNGLRLPLVRMAVDGSGERELGRVLVSHGGGGRACQLCPLSAEDLLRPSRRIPCPGRAAEGIAPTIAGSAIGMMTAGLALLQAQRLLGGNDAEKALDREVLLDLDHFQSMGLRLERSGSCLSGHEPWELEPAGLPAEATLADLFERARAGLRAHEVALEPFLHPLCVEADCACGERVPAAGSRFATPPACPACGARTAWRLDVAVARITPGLARELGVESKPIAELGLPERGAMVIARTPDRSPLRLVLD